MHLPQLLILVLIIFSYQVGAASWLQNQYHGSIFAFGKQSYANRNSLLRKSGSGSMVNHFACYDSNTFPESVLTGGMATFDVYNFTNLKDTQLIGSAIWVKNEPAGDPRHTNAIVVGWEVNPSRYGDMKTHFFAEWAADGYGSSGCENLKCDGFVPVNYAPITPGDIIEKFFGQITIKIFKSKDDGDWWLHFGYGNKNLSRVGYWPKSIFTNLSDHANYITWGGCTVSTVGDASPAMGNGKWPGETGAFVREIKYVNTDGQGDSEPAPGHMGLRAYVTHDKCYGLGPFINDKFSYGGPGGCTE